jgi:dynein light chain LC8-type
MASEMRKCLVKASDMQPEQQQSVCDMAIAAFTKYQSESDVAKHLKKEMDVTFGQLWHCIVGKSFGSFVSHHPGTFIYFYCNNIAILLFKSPQLEEAD